MKQVILDAMLQRKDKDEEEDRLSPAADGAGASVNHDRIVKP